MSERILRLAIPAGSLQEATVALFRKAGYNLSVESRSYSPSVDDSEIACTLIRAQEIPRYVQDGLMDAGLTGYDQIQESEADVVEVAELNYSKASSKPYRWVIAVTKESPIQSIKDLEGKRIASELPNFTRRHLEKHGVKALVEFSWGATEAKPPLLADAVVDGIETGSSLRANNLRVIDKLLESTTRFVANKAAWDDSWKRQKIEDIVLMLKGAMAANGKVGLMMNIRRTALDDVVAILPALQQPTISSLADDAWVALNTIVDESVVHRIVPKLKQAGAEGIVEYPLNKIIE